MAGYCATKGGVRLFATAVALECAWEVIENTDFVIRRYRERTIALGYYGDSVINSVGDILAAVLLLTVGAGLQPGGDLRDLDVPDWLRRAGSAAIHAASSNAPSTTMRARKLATLREYRKLACVGIADGGLLSPHTTTP